MNKKEIKIDDSITLIIKQEEDTTIIEIKGYIDYTNYLDFQRQINPYIKNNAKIVFICKELNFISSSGIASFVQFSKKMEEKNGKVIFVSFQKKIVEVLNAIKLDKTLLIIEDMNKLKEILKK